MRISRRSRLFIPAVIAAVSALVAAAPASATVGGGGGGGSCNVNFPSFTQQAPAIVAPQLGKIYSLQLAYGTLEAAWNNYGTLSVAYVKTGGSQITADFQVYGLTGGGVCFYKDDNGAFTESAGQTRSFTWSPVSLAEPTEAVMYVQGQGYFGILFYYN